MDKPNYFSIGQVGRPFIRLYHPILGELTVSVQIV